MVRKDYLPERGCVQSTSRSTLGTLWSQVNSCCPVLGSDVVRRQNGTPSTVSAGLKRTDLRAETVLGVPNHTATGFW